MNRLKITTRHVAFALALAVLSSCGEKKQDSADGTQNEKGNNPAEATEKDRAEAEAKAKAQQEAEEKAELQQSLVDEAIALIGRVADTTITVKDLATAKTAATKIAEIDTEFLALAKKMEEAGDPTPALVTSFREQYNIASNSMRKRINAAMPDLSENKPVTEVLNQAFNDFGTTLSHPAFKTYGIDGS